MRKGPGNWEQETSLQWEKIHKVFVIKWTLRGVSPSKRPFQAKTILPRPDSAQHIVELREFGHGWSRELDS